MALRDTPQPGISAASTKKAPEQGLPCSGVVGEGGFEPPKSVTTDLQSAPFDRSGIPPYELGAGGRIRTPDLLITNQLLYQLSYTSSSNSRIYITRWAAFCQQDFTAFSGFFLERPFRPRERAEKGGTWLNNPLRRRFGRRPPQTLCTLCGREIREGEHYWYLNGASVCGDCFCAFAKDELAPYGRICGREAE